MFPQNIYIIYEWVQKDTVCNLPSAVLVGSSQLLKPVMQFSVHFPTALCGTDKIKTSANKTLNLITWHIKPMNEHETFEVQVNL